MLPIKPHSLLQAEIVAARLEAALSCDEPLEALWRAEASIGEAVASVAMEDIRVIEPDLLARIAENSIGAVDSRGIETAWQILRVLRAPGDILADPVGVVRRIEEACGGPRPKEESDGVSDEEIVFMARDIEQMREMPLCAAIRAAALYGVLSQRRAPAAERLIFCAVDAVLRHRSRRRLREAEEELQLFNPLPQSGPFVMPATALARAGRLVWSPPRPGGIEELAQGLTRGLSWDLGQIGVLRRLARQLERAGEGRGRRSRRGDVGRWLLHHPVVTSASLVEAFGFSRRGALDMIADLEAEGLLRLLTPRRAARIWATPSLARRLEKRAVPTSRAALRLEPAFVDPRKPPAQEEIGMARELTVGAARDLRAEGQASIDEALAAMDRAMREADVILSGISLLRRTENEEDPDA